MSRMGWRWRGAVGVAAVMLLLGSSQQAPATPFFELHAQACTEFVPDAKCDGDFKQVSATDPRPIDGRAVSSAGGGSFSAFALVDGGPGAQLKGTAIASARTSPSVGGSTAGFVNTAIVVQDITFSGPGLVTTSLNLLISGTVTAQATPATFNPSIAKTYAEAKAEVFAELFQINQTPVVMWGRRRIRHLVPNAPILTDEGIFTNVPNDKTPTTVLSSPFVVVPGLSVRLIARLNLLAHALPGGHDGFATATADFADSFGLPTNGPVFNLPPGFTANSADGLIVNNRYVPEPGLSLLVLAGLLGLAMRERARRKAAGTPKH